ncbi:MAG TPA: alpha/beta hydrolase [Microcella sp.]|nr:alpha/beta hydrolase [Microcella sp.]
MSILARIRVAGWSALVALLLAVIAFLVWAYSPYRADRAAIVDVLEDARVTLATTDAGIVITPTAAEPDAGLVFFPGARVEPYAYVPTMAEVAIATGRVVVIPLPPLNLAIADTRPIDAFTTAAPAVDNWALGGHSLGGVRACLLAQESTASATGLLLLGSFCANDLSATELGVVSVEGTNDGLSRPEQIDEAAALLPTSATRILIDGANHASFGDYGAQAGDGPLETDRSAVRRAVAEAATLLP